MSEIEYEADHVKHSVGGRGGHIFRRCFHVGLVIFPWLYFEHGESIGDIISLNPVQFAAMLGVLAFGVELLRMKLGILIVGQREYEKHQFSALAWGAISITLTLVALSPWEGTGGQQAGWLAYPIIFSLAFGDPSMGEARRKGMGDQAVYTIGTIVCVIVWLACGYFFGTPYWMALLMGPLTMVAELPKLRWIDDNATMILIPLAAVLFIVPFL
jgi:Ni,Fe-hydrogenase I cytochrome b subunit